MPSDFPEYWSRQDKIDGIKNWWSIHRKNYEYPCTAAVDFLLAEVDQRDEALAELKVVNTDA